MDSEKDNPANEYRIFSLNPDVRCGKCAFKGRRINASNLMCVRLNDTTNNFATCNRFRPDRPLRPEDKSENE